jgi:4-amino-4-deoxy-L-arabinose transferase-like glycosyltransferase
MRSPIELRHRFDGLSPEERRPALILAAICTFAVVLGLWNAHIYPPGRGYDGAAHMAYADSLVPGGHIPRGTGEYYIPPAFYAIAGCADWLAKEAGLGEPHRATQALNVLLVLAAILLVWKTAGLLWPGRRLLGLTAAGFVALVPATVKSEAMFHPETLELFASTLALYLCVRLLKQGPSVANAVALGAALGFGELVRPFEFWTTGALALALAAARRWRELAIVVALAVAIATPWYIRQVIVYGTPTPFPRAAPSTPLYDRRPLRFYIDPGIPQVFTRPYRPSFLNLAIPTTYSEIWGDYFGGWVYQGTHVTASERHRDEVQAVVGLLPTALAIAGWIALLAGSLRRPARIAVAGLPAIGLLGYLYFTVAYPSADGDVIKGTYLLPTLAGWALGFGYALDRLPPRLLVVVASVLAVCVLADLPFLVYR